MLLTYVFLDIFRAYRLVGSVRWIQGSEDQSENRINEPVNEGSRRHYRQKHRQQSDVVQRHFYRERLQPVTAPGHRLSRQKLADSHPMDHRDRQFVRSRHVLLENIYRRSAVFSRIHRIVNLFLSISLSLSRRATTTFLYSWNLGHFRRSCDDRRTGTTSRAATQNRNYLSDITLTCVSDVAANSI